MPVKKSEIIQNFEGLISAPFTAFTPDGNVTADVIPDYINFLVSQGVKGVFVNGTTGEGLSLTVEERKFTAEAWVKYGADKLEVILIQIGANSLKDVQELASHAEKIGATGIASPPSLFYKATTHEQIIEYYKKIALAAPTLPLMLYHVPSYSNQELCLGEFLPKIRKEIPTFIGAKFTSADVRDLLKIHSLPEKPFKFKILSGFEEVLLPCMACGVTASVGAVYNFMAPVALKVIGALKEGKIEEARKHQMEILKAVETIERYGQGIACFKAAMNILGPFDFGPPRLPLVSLDSQALRKLKEDLVELKAKQNWRI